MALSVCFIQFALLTPAGAQSATDYTLNTQDVLKIRVGGWDVTRNTYEEWGGLSGDYTVGVDGKISFPYVGSLAVAGSTIEQVSSTISQNLKIAIGLPQSPAVAIEISSYNPIFVTGDVNRPGEYTFRPETTVRQAIAMAGGVGQGGVSGLEIDQSILRAYGQRRSLILGQQRLLLRISRLEAEINNQDTFLVPAEIQTKLLDSGLITLEQEIFSNNTEALKQRMLSTEELSELLKTVINGLDSQLDLAREEITLTSKDLENKRKLLSKGTIRAGDVTSVTRILTQQRIREIELTVQKLQAEQSLIQAQHEKIDIEKTNAASLLQQLDDARTRLSEMALAIDLQTDLYASTLEFAGNSLEDATDLPLSISVIGHGENASKDTVANEQTTLRPGDTVVIRIPSPTGDDAQVR